MDVAESTVSLIASSLGMKRVKPEVARKLSFETQQFIINVVEKANVFAMIQKKFRLTSTDINDSLESYGMEPLYGYNHMKKKKLVVIPYSKLESLTFTADRKLDINEIANWKPLPYQLAPHFKIFPLISNGIISKFENREIATPGEDTVQSINIVDSSTRIKAYFHKSISYLYENESVFQTVIRNIATDEYTGELLPKYLEFVEEFLETTQNDFKKCVRVLRFLNAICSNPEYRIIDRIDDIISYGLTFLTTTADKNASHAVKCELYKYSVLFLTNVVSIVSSMIPDLKCSLAVQIRSILGMKNAYSLAGSIQILYELGPDIFSVEFLPRLKEIHDLCCQDCFTKEEKSIAMYEFQSVLTQIIRFMTYSDLNLILNPNVVNPGELISLILEFADHSCFILDQNITL